MRPWLRLLQFKWLYQGWGVGAWLCVHPYFRLTDRRAGCVIHFVYSTERDFCLPSLHPTYFHIKMTKMYFGCQSVSFCWCSGTGQHTVNCKGQHLLNSGVEAEFAHVHYNSTQWLWRQRQDIGPQQRGFVFFFNLHFYWVLHKGTKWQKAIFNTQTIQ